MPFNCNNTSILNNNIFLRYYDDDYEGYEEPDGDHHEPEKRSNFAHALRIRKAERSPFSHALRIKKAPSSYSHALRIRSQPIGYALRIKKSNTNFDRRANIIGHALRVRKSGSLPSLYEERYFQDMPSWTKRKASLAHVLRV